MPQIRDIALEQLTAAGNALAITGTRVDAAHSLGDALASGPPLAEMPVAEAIAELVRVEGAVQLQSQADQLAAHLRQRQKDIDRREAQLNARLADFEKEVRAARLWLAERNEALNEREAKLEGSGFRVQGSGDHAGHGARVQGSGGNDADRPPSVGNALCGVPLPTERFVDTNEAHSGLADPRWQAERADQKAAFLKRSEDLNLRQRELEKFREKVSQMHHEALQLRLAAEEAQAELRASLGVELADKAVVLGRRRLARYFQDEAAELTRRRNELEWLRGEQAPEYTTWQTSDG